MEQTISAVQILLGIFLIVLIVLQSKGTGMGTAFGGDMGFYGTKRGAEKVLFVFTIVVSVAFFILSIVGVYF